MNGLLRTAAAMMTLAWALAAVAAPDPMVYVRMDASPQNLAALEGTRSSIVGGTANVVDAYVLPEDLWQLDAWSIDYQVLAEDYHDLMPQTRAEYHDNAEIEQALEELETAYPDLVRTVDVGTSVDGRTMFGVVITADVVTRQLRPGMRLTGAHHGDEWSSMEVALEIAHVLAENYGVDADITELVDSQEIWIVPAVNPDGLESYSRYNANGTDLNRNYSYEWESGWSHGPDPFSEPENNAIRALSLRRSFAHSLSYHSGATVCNYLYNYTSWNTPDEALLEELCLVYEAATDTPDFYSTNGYDWYETHGDTNDWSYGVRGGHDYTLEVTSQKAPPENQIEEYLDWHVDATLLFLLEGARMGVQGQITDADTGYPIEARVTDQPDGWPVYADADTGVYHKLLFAGSYELRVEAPGYDTQTVQVTVSAGAAATLDVSLEPQATGGATLEHSEPSVVELDGGAATVRLLGSGLTGWADQAVLQRWDADTLPLAVTESGDDLILEFDAEDMEPEYSREGLWWITVEGGGDVASLPRGIVVVGGGDPLFQLSTVSWVPDAGGPGIHRITITGDAIPHGSDVLLVGGGAVSWPTLVELQEATLVTALFDGNALADGTWDLVVYGGGHYRALDDALLTEDGEFIEGGDDDDDTGDDDTAGDDDSAGDDDTAADDDDDVDDDTTDDDDDTTSDTLDEDGLMFAGNGCSCSSVSDRGMASLLGLVGLVGLLLRRRR